MSPLIIGKIIPILSLHFWLVKRPLFNKDGIVSVRKQNQYDHWPIAYIAPCTHDDGVLAAISFEHVMCVKQEYASMHSIHTVAMA